MTANPEQQLGIVTRHFRSMFNTDQVSQLSQILPTEMKIKFIGEETQRAVALLKDNIRASARIN